METESGVLASVELNVSVQFGYQVKTEAVFQKGVAEIGRSAGMNTFFNGQISATEHMSFKTRFAAAYDAQIQRWVNAAKNRTIDGPGAWDGYLATEAVLSGLGALQNGAKVETKYASKPAFYN